MKNLVHICWSGLGFTLGSWIVSQMQSLGGALHLIPLGGVWGGLCT